MTDTLHLEPSARHLALAKNGEAEFDRPKQQSDQWDDSDSALSIVEVLQMVLAHWLWVAAAALLGLLAALAFSLSQTPMYRATAIIELNPPTVPILSGGAGAGEELIVPDTDWQFLQTQIGILRSRALAEKVVQDLNLASSQEFVGREDDISRNQLAAEIAGGLTVTPSADSRLVELSYVSPNAILSANLANGFSTSFVQLTLDRKYEATKTAREFLGERLATVRRDLTEAEEELVAYAKANGIVLIPQTGSDGDAGTSSLTGSSLTALNEALAAAQSKRIVAEQRFRQAGSIGEVEAATSGLRQQMASLQAEAEEKSSYMQDDFPDMVRLNNRIAELDRQINQAASRAVSSLRAEYRAALAEENALRGRVATLSSSALDEREDSIQYNTLKRELDTNRSLYDALLARFNEVGVAEGIGSAQAAVLDRAQAPSGPYTPNTLLNLLVGTFAGFLLGAALAFVYEFLTNTIKTKDDVNEKLKLPALGAIPVKEKGNELSEQLKDASSQVYESYANLRTTLQFSTRIGFPKTLLVTSSNPAEGKSTTSYSLALQLADSGKRVLLIDADMRKPTFVAGEQADFGLSHLLTSHEAAKHHILQTSHENFFLMPSGPIPPNPANILRPAKLSSLFEELDLLFDAIVVDAPPILGFADALLLGAACHGALFAVESGKTRTKTAQSALNQLQMAGVQVLGAVLTKAKFSTKDYGYTYRYYQSALERGERSELVAGLSGADDDETWRKADF